MVNKKKLSFSWVLVDELMVGSAPLTYDHLIELEKEGIKGVLTLCSNKEVEIPVEINKFFINERFVLPDHTFRKYPEPEEILKVLKILENLIKNGPVYVHCFAGVERSPLVCMAWLIKKYNMGVNESLTYMMSMHKKTNPLPLQLNCLNKMTEILSK